MLALVILAVLCLGVTQASAGELRRRLSVSAQWDPWTRMATVIPRLLSTATVPSHTNH